MSETFSNAEAVAAFRDVYLPDILTGVEASLERGGGVHLERNVTVFEREVDGSIVIEISDTDPGEGWS